MNARTAFYGLLLTAALAAAGEDSGVVNITARQRWPWSPVVDIDFTTVTSNVNVKFIAQYDGVEPFELAEKDLTGDFAVKLQPGLHHATWDPVRAGLGATELKNFRVTAAPDTTDRTYLILSLVDGSYRYMAAPPEGGWLSDPAYYQTNMVFRRIPGGRAVLGLPNDLRTKVGAGDNVGRTHVATLSSDYYLAIYLTTAAQHDFACSNAVGVTLNVAKKKAEVRRNVHSYNSLRGSVSDDGINWPHTRYEVAEDCVIAAFRTVTASNLPREWIIDLPTQVQWERAARADTPTNWLWSVGGTVENTGAELTNLVYQIGCLPGNTSTGTSNVGKLLPNGWGLYDMVGLCHEWALDYSETDMSYYSGLDPVGPPSASNNYRARLSARNDTAKFSYWTTSVNVTGPPGNDFNYRLCIHLKSLFRYK